MARTQRADGESVRRRPKRGREDQVAPILDKIKQAKPTGLAARLERAAETGVLDDPDEPEPVPEQPEPAAESEVDGEGEWTATLPPLTSEEQDDLHAYAQSDSLSADEATDEDLDALWDGVREDPEQGVQFLGTRPSSSTAMRQMVRSLFAEHFFALWDDTVARGKVIVGFGAFQPVAGNNMLTHLFLLPEFKPEGLRLTPQFLEMAANQYPGKTFVVQTAEPGRAKLLKRVGFTESYLLKWTPPPPKVESQE